MEETLLKPRMDEKKLAGIFRYRAAAARVYAARRRGNRPSERELFLLLKGQPVASLSPQEWLDLSAVMHQVFRAYWQRYIQRSLSFSPGADDETQASHFTSGVVSARVSLPNEQGTPASRQEVLLMLRGQPVACLSDEEWQDLSTVVDDVLAVLRYLRAGISVAAFKQLYPSDCLVTPNYLAPG